LFVDPTLYVNETVVEGGLLSIFSPSLLPTNGTAVLEATIGELLDLYPPVPSAGSPFGTGNQTFGYSAAYKQMAAIGTARTSIL
jgi:acetylcholinesterase